jgi:hypothetical protein
MKSSLNVFISFVLTGLTVANSGLAQVRDKTSAKAKEAQVQIPSVDEKDLLYYRQFLDKNGGYKDAKGGYYDPKVGTYTDEVGGVVDNWGGYTYKSGSYKTQYGDFYDAKENTFKLTDGQVIKADPGTTPAQAIQVMRDDVESRGGFDKDFTRKSMMQQIKFEHPKTSGSPPPKAN